MNGEGPNPLLSVAGNAKQLCRWMSAPWYAPGVRQPKDCARPLNWPPCAGEVARAQHFVPWV